jgi:fructose transport system permease protein
MAPLDVAELRPSMSRTQKLPPGHAGPLHLRPAAACLFFATQSDRFLSGGNLSLILQQVMVVGVIAIGQTLIILTAAST